MWVPILPFLLVANVTNNDHRSEGQMYNLQYEYIYELVLNMTILNPDKQNDIYCQKVVVAELKCRPKRKDALICYIENGRNVNSICAENKSLPEFEELLNDNNTIFYIRFGEQGIEDLIVSKDINMFSSPCKLEIIRELARQLDVGISVTINNVRDPDITDGLFADMIPHIRKKDTHDYRENSITLNRSVLDSEEDNVTESKNFELAFVVSNVTQPQQIGGSKVEKWHLIKHRQIIRSCYPLIICDSVVREQIPHVISRLNKNSSWTDIKISKNEFMSSTNSDVLISIRVSPYTFPPRYKLMKQILSIELKRIDFTKFSLSEKKIKNPISVSAVYGSI